MNHLSLIDNQEKSTRKTSVAVAAVAERMKGKTSSYLIDQVKNKIIHG
jgi:hypothetical protein